MINTILKYFANSTDDIERIKVIREKSLNNTITIMGILSIIPIIALLIRQNSAVYSSFVYIQVLIVINIIAIVLLKNKLSYKFKAIPFVGSIILSGIVSILEQGLYGISIVLVVGGCIFTTFYLGRKISVVISSLSFSIVIVIGILFIFDIVQIHQNPVYIIHSPFSWIITLSISAMILSLYIYNQQLQNNAVNDTIKELNKRTQELVSSNAKLSSEIFTRQKSEIALKISEEKFRLLFNEANDAILIIEGAIITNCNIRAEELFNARSSNIIGKTPYDLSPNYQPDGESSKEKAIKILKNAKIVENQRFEWTHKSLSGKNIETEVSLKEIKIGEKQVVHVIIRDISLRKVYERELETHKTNLENIVKERTREVEDINEELIKTNENLNFLNNLLEKENKIREMAEEELIKYQQELRESNATKDKFFSIIAHDLKNPFHLIMNFSELLSGKMGKYDEEKQKKFIEYIGKTAKHGYDLLKNLLEWARSQTSTIKYEPKNTNLDKITAETIQLLHASATEKNIELSMHMPQNSLVFADTEMLKTVIRNLISNAIKFTDKNGKIEVVAKEGNNEYKVFVRDNGVGMSEQQTKKLFQLGCEQSTTGTSGEEGTGLGLILCKEFITKNSGEIWVESNIGIGTTIYFTIPSCKE